MAERLSALDGSFLRVETESAHMHVPRFRRRLAYAPTGLGEPFWVDDPDFDVADHVLPLGTAGPVVDQRAFELLCDRFLSVPLPRDRPLWEIRIAPRLQAIVAVW